MGSAQSQAILRLYPRSAADHPDQHVWWHLSYGNLESRCFTVLPLMLDPFDQHGIDGSVDLLA
eukprot:4111029-Heterocapsa_arctica.AAC.1